jgi:hypothetical protein
MVPNAGKDRPLEHRATHSGLSLWSQPILEKMPKVSGTGDRLYAGSKDGSLEPLIMGEGHRFGHEFTEASTYDNPCASRSGAPIAMKR